MGLFPSSGLRVTNKIDECKDKTTRILVRSKVRVLAVHRTIWEPGDAVGVCKRFQDPDDLGAYTGRENPYHFLIQPDAVAVQCIELSERGAHARRWNSSAIAVALMHDTLHSPLPHEMGVTLIKLCRLLCVWLGGVRGVVYGHDELPAGSSNPNKRCPAIDMENVRDLLDDGMAPWLKLDPKEIEKLLTDAGITL